MPRHAHRSSMAREALKAQVVAGPAPKIGGIGLASDWGLKLNIPSTWPAFFGGTRALGLMACHIFC
jgi:hypothetical protein